MPLQDLQPQYIPTAYSLWPTRHWDALRPAACLTGSGLWGRSVTAPWTNGMHPSCVILPFPRSCSQLWMRSIQVGIGTATAAAAANSSVSIPMGYKRTPASTASHIDTHPGPDVRALALKTGRSPLGG